MAGNDSNTRLLLHFDGSGSSVEDSALGGAAKAFTINGTQTTAQKKFDYGSLLANIGGPNCRVSANTDWNLAALEWILDGWFYITDTANPFLFAWYVDVDNYLAVERVNTAGGSVSFGFRLRIGGLNLALSSGGTAVAMLNTWKHVCLSRSGQTIRLFIDGTLHTSATLPTSSWPINLTLLPLFVGGGVERADRMLRYLAGYIDEVRLQMNSARTANFTPPVDAYRPTLECICTGQYPALAALEMVVTGEYVSGPQPVEIVCTGAWDSPVSTEFVCTGEYDAAAAHEFVCTGSYESGLQSREFVCTGEYDGVGAREIVCTGSYAACDISIEVVATGAYKSHVGCEAVATGEYVAAGMMEMVATGAYEAEDDTVEGYELYHGIDEMPDFEAAPAATSATLPFDYVFTGEGLHYLVVRYRNSFGLCSQNITPTIIELDASDNAIMVRPSAPRAFAVEPQASATVRVTADYVYNEDGDAQADQWLIFTTNDGGDPDPDVDTPTVVDMVRLNGAAYLDWTSGTFTAGQTIKVLVQTRRTSPARDSSNLTPVSTVAVSAGLSAPSPSAFHKVSGVMVEVS